MAEEVTLEQAEKALQQLRPDFGQEEEATAVPEVDLTPDPVTTEEEPPVETVEVAGTEAVETEAVTTEEVQEEPAADDPVKVALADQQQRHDEQLGATKTRYEQSLRILKDRGLRKSTASDQALKVLQGFLTEDGVEKDDVQRVISQIQGTMNPASPSYVEPAPQPAQATEGREDQQLVLNDFFNEKGMTQAEAVEFGNWVRDEGDTHLSAAEQAVAEHSFEGFLRIAEPRWREGVSNKEKQTKTTNAVASVASVQRTQRQAAKAASAAPAAPHKSPPRPQPGVKLKDLTDNDISALVRQSVVQYH